MRLVKDYIEIADYTSLDKLIERLLELKQDLPEDCEAELTLRGDDIFGRHLAIGYLRRQSEEEAACDARYADDGTAKRRLGRMRRAA